MKYGITVNSYFPHKDGVQFITQSLAERLVADGNEVTVITSLAQGHENIEVINGVSVIRNDIRNIATFFWGDKREYQKNVIELSHSVDVIIFVGLQRATTGWVMPILDDICCKKILYVHGIHDFKFSKVDFISIKNFAMKIYRNIRWKVFFSYHKSNLKKIDITIQLHEEDDGYKFFERILPGKNFVLMNFAEPMFFVSQPKVTKKNQFVYISNFTYGKNQQLLLKAFYHMKEDAHLLMIGSKKNKYFAKLIRLNEKLSKQYGEKNIDILYGINRNKFPDILMKSKAFVMTSYSEKFPITVIEAMSAGTPFISTNVGIVRHLKGGTIVSYDENEIASRMDEYIVDTERYVLIQKEAENFAKDNFSMDNYMRKFYKILENI